ncbi:orange carotenoid protein N-terminal domain-containing protein [Microseira sp. BLCC-F43]|jgi:hypothetical protein|uniref:orange carotenoid protein N-terminal domain-containing protein n=1 Tax=Microseira sp. BLCC-F43 TaxID=3153602 RepID=UPI0035B92841
MTFTADFASTRFSNPFAANNQLADAVPATTALFKRLSVDDQLAALWYIYTEMGRSITPAAPGGKNSLKKSTYFCLNLPKH